MSWMSTPSGMGLSDRCKVCDEPIMVFKEVDLRDSIAITEEYLVSEVQTKLDIHHTIHHGDLFKML